ncbi:MAG TPA: hypothetical protein VKA32_01725 [Gammaproteobacteria bacterium]|nr:hypothetical protein [Gammaproteobacteria bacterium]
MTATSERGYRPTPENRTERLYRMMWVDTNLRSAILDIREMDRLDTRAKKIHTRMSRAATKGGLQLRSRPQDKILQRLFKDYVRRLQLDQQEKLESDMRGLVMEGNLPMQWVVDRERRRVVSGVRMPSETILPNVDANRLFKSAKAAYLQHDIATGTLLATFSLWQLTMARLTPDNFDDHGALGRPYMDAARSFWKKLNMTEEDLVVRRRERAPLRTAHVLEGATDEDMKAYQDRVEDEQKEITTNYYMNRKGAVTAVQGDANLDQIKDIVLLLDAFFAGAPAPKQLFGYVEGLNRDILEDLKKDYYDELDALQDTLSGVYKKGFRLELLLNGINPDAYEFSIQFAERQTETLNQRADRGLKLKAVGASQRTVWETAGLDPDRELALRKDQLKSDDPYPGLDEEAAGGAGQRVSITPGNRRKGESSTDITQRSSF